MKPTGMLNPQGIDLASEQDEVKGFARTIAEIEWLLLILVLVFLVAVGPEGEGGVAIHMALFFLGAFILALHYTHFYKTETRTKLAIETWVMIIFVTWVAWYSGKIDSPLVSLYLLPIIASALILGKLMTAIEIAAVTACYIGMAYASKEAILTSFAYWGMVYALVAPVVLVAYITTMLSADIRFAVEKIRQISETDELTGVYNMRGFTVILRRTFQQAARHGRSLSIVMMDSDNLKVVNDAHGHDAGNRLLQHLIRKVVDQLRQTDVVARFGGDEFIALLPETDRAGAMQTAERIRRSVEASSFDVRGKEVQITVSLGLASYPHDGADVDMIVGKADKALYRAKRTGRNRVAAYEISDDEEGNG